MERTLRFLVIEFPSEAFVMARFTRAHPACTVDLITEDPGRGPPGVSPVVFLVKGVPWRQAQGLLAELGRVHEPPEVLHRDPGRQAWLCRVRIHEERLGAEGLALAQFRDRFGPPWAHLEQGVLHLRARLPDAQDAETLVAQLLGFLEATGTQAQLDVMELGPHDYGVWEELLQASAAAARSGTDA